MAVIAIIFFFFNDTATTEIYTLSLHDALPIYGRPQPIRFGLSLGQQPRLVEAHDMTVLDARLAVDRSEEHTSELQSRLHLVCRLLLEKKNQLLDLVAQRRHRLAPASPSLGILE